MHIYKMRGIFLKHTLKFYINWLILDHKTFDYKNIVSLSSHCPTTGLSSNLDWDYFYLDGYTYCGYIRSYSM